MKRRVAILSAIVLGFGAPAAQACVPGPPGIAKPSSAYIARRLVAEAVAVDLVVLERSERLSSAAFARGLFGSGPGQVKYRRDLFEGQRSLADEYEPSRLTFKVVESLKGNGARRFQLNGIGPASNSSIQSLAIYANPQEVEAVELTPLNLSPGTCLSFPGALKGVRYLVFRDGKGALLRTTIPWKAYQRGGPSYLAVPKADDPWLRTVRKALADEGRRRGAPRP